MYNKQTNKQTNTRVVLIKMKKVPGFNCLIIVFTKVDLPDPDSAKKEFYK